ncbi:MAG: hypothetical protein ACOX46_12480 [Limnochordia bacterium]
MAQLLGVPEGPFKNWLHRAREKLRVPLESEEEICLYRRTSMPCGCWPASTKLALTAWRKKIGTTGTSLTTTWKRAWLSWSVSRNCSQAQRWKRPCAQSAACCPDSLTADRTVKPQDCPTSARCVTIWMAIAYRICPSRSGVPPR